MRPAPDRCPRSVGPAAGYFGISAVTLMLEYQAARLATSLSLRLWP